MRINTIRKRGLIIILLILIFVLLSGVFFYPFQIHFIKGKDGVKINNFIFKTKVAENNICYEQNQFYNGPTIYGSFLYDKVTNKEIEFFDKKGQSIQLKFCGEFEELTLVNDNGQTYLLYRQLGGGSEVSYFYLLFKQQISSLKFRQFYPELLACYKDPLLWNNELRFKYFYNDLGYENCSDFIHNFWFEPGRVERVRLN